MYNCFYHRHSLANAIVNYIDYYNNQRIQRKLHIMTPME
ncbi:MAG: IS3 family transposase [Catenibacillus sp.]